MRIALLICDHVLDKYRPIAGGYEDMFPALWPEVQLTPFFVCDGQFPPAVEAFDAYLCSGSRFSVYDDIDWIHNLKAWVLDIHRAKKLFVGVCFGHQMLAEALGGKVQCASVGWCVGAHAFEMVAREPWMVPFAASLRLPMLCQDQVVTLPPGSVVLGQAGDCPVGIFRVGTKMLGIQAHPEFAKAYLLAVLTDRVDRVGKEKTAAAISSLEVDMDGSVVASWIMNFFNEN